MQENNKLGSEALLGIGTLIFSVMGLFLAAISYSTGYYTFGDNYSWPVMLLVLGAIAIEAVAVGIGRRFDKMFWANVITFAVTACLGFALCMLLADRVEGIGTCIVTDYDSGHGGEEAIYLSIGAIAFWFFGVIFNIIGSFIGNKDAKDDAKKVMKRFFVVLFAIVFITAAIFPPALIKAGFIGGSGSKGSGTAGSGTTYTITYSQDAGNAEDIPDDQFLGCNLGGFVQADARFMIDITLTLADDGTYTLKSDGYVIESGKRCEIGDDTGLGMVLITDASGIYTDNGDGTVTTAAATSVTFELETDTYSAQMKEAGGIGVDDSSEDGTYTSEDYPSVLDFVPETIWTLNEDGTIATYENDNTGGEVSEEEVSEEEASEVETEDTESAESAEVTIASDDGATQITFRADGTYVFEFPSYSVTDEGTYTYDGTTLTVTNSTGTEMTAEGDPMSLHYISGVSDQLTGDFTISASDIPSDSEAAEVTIASDDGATQITFRADGTYVFEFPSYSVSDEGTYTYDGTTLIVTNSTGTDMKAEGDPMSLHYISGVSDQLTGDFTIEASCLK